MNNFVATSDLAAALDSLCARGDGIAAVAYSFAQYYLPGSPVIDLMGVFAVSGRGERVAALVTDRVALARRQVAAAERGIATGANTLSPHLVLREIANVLGTPVVDLAAPLSLDPVRIPKPWGQEIWYTGIEARGQARVTDGTYSVPLPWVLTLAPRRLIASDAQQVNLLKILDPLPEPVYGDLYFELHEEKREVYIVTHVDRDAWPDGTGAIRFGFDGQVRQQYATEGDFRAAYLAAVSAYEQVRRKIDCALDKRRAQAGFGVDDTVDTASLKRWQDDLSAADRAEERRLREVMNRFTQLKPLRVGDVVKVPCLTPHALQHGVRTVEFQTPVYERKILSFAQKVLTQDHWDTREAVALMAVDTPGEDGLEVIEDQAGVRRELVACFDDFAVQRLAMTPGAQWQWQANGTYALAIVVMGSFNVGDRMLGPECAVLVPARRAEMMVRNSGCDEAVLLIAEPRCP